MIVLNDYIFGGRKQNIIAVYFFSAVFVLSESSYIKVIAEYLAYGHTAPAAAAPESRGLPHKFTAQYLVLPCSGDIHFRKLVGDSLVAHSRQIHIVYHSYDLCLLFVHLKLHSLAVGHGVAVGDSTYPSAFFLAVLNDLADLLTGISNRHLVYQESELYLQPLVACGKVYAIVY